MKKKRVLIILLTVILSMSATFAAIALYLKPGALDVGQIDLTAVEDGTYTGVCQNKILIAVVQVEVKDHKIVSIEILEHKVSYMEQAERISGDVIDNQSLQVDAISGATLTSDTVLKAIEDALEQGVSE